MLLIIFHLASGFEKDKDSILICHSLNTPVKLFNMFAGYPLNLNLSSNSVDNSIQMIDYISIIIDITKDLSLYSKLDELSQQFKAFYITITPPSGQTSSSLRFHLHPGLNKIENAINILLDYLKWQEFSIFASNQEKDQFLASNIHSTYNRIIKSFIIYEDDLNDFKSDEIVRKLIKTEGVKNLLIIDDGNSLSSFQKSLTFRKIAKFGTYLVFLNQGIYTVDIEGALVLSEPGTETSKSEEHFEFLTISNFLKLLTVISSTELKTKCPNQVCFNSFNLVNIWQGTKKIIGTIENSLELTDQAVFPENNTSIFSKSKKSKIVISIANGTSILYNEGFIPIFAYWYQGAQFAVSRSNFMQEFENFEFELFPTDCGNLIYDEEWFKTCLSSVVNSLGVAYLSNFLADAAKGNLVALQSLSKQIPQVSPLAVSVELENITAFPNLLKLGSQEEFYALSCVRILQNLRWKDIIFFGSDESDYMSSIISTIELFNKGQVNIINPPNLRIFRSNYTRDDFEQYKEFFQFAKRSKCRIFFFSATNTKFIIEGLYDIGLRKGDLIMITDGSVNDILREDIEEKYMKKRTELLVGSLLYAFVEWEGELGKILKNEMSGMFDDISFMCLTYDTVSVVKNSIEHLIAIGEDFEDPIKLSESMRVQKFKGCLGDVYFNPETNFRASWLLSFKQFKYNKTTEKYISEDFILFSTFSDVPIRYISEPQWPTDDNTIPGNYIEYSECGFDDRLVRKSEKSQNMIFIISSILLIISGIFAFWSWRFFSDCYFELKENQEMNLNDYFYLLFFLFEFFELISLGPKNGIFSFALKRTEFLLAVDLTTYFEYTFEKFWILYLVILVVTYAFIFLSLIAFFISRELLKENYFLSKLQDLSDVLLPIIGHLGFHPLISLLINICLCEEAIGENLDESFLDNDCSQFCYTGKHKVYLVAGIIAAVGFLTVGVFLRPYWESIQFCLNLRTKTWYLSVLSVFQTLCILCRKSLKTYDEATPGFIISCLIVILILITALKKPFNYSRVAIYQLTSLAMALWSLLVSSVFVYLSGNSIMVPVLVVGLFVILGFGLLISTKYQKLFISQTYNPIPGLIRFQFTGKIEYMKNRSIHVVEEGKNLNNLFESPEKSN